MSKHTPGPWYWMGDNTLVAGHGHRPVIITAGRSSNYGQPQMMERDDASGRLVPLKIDGPNARLLAASPMLLALLEEVHDHADKYGAVPKSADLLWGRVKAAIAAARGEQ